MRLLFKQDAVGVGNCMVSLHHYRDSSKYRQVGNVRHSSQMNLALDTSNSVVYAGA